METFSKLWLYGPSILLSLEDAFRIFAISYTPSMNTSCGAISNIYYALAKIVEFSIIFYFFVLNNGRLNISKRVLSVGILISLGNFELLIINNFIT